MASAVRELLGRARPDADRGPVRIGDVLATIADAMRLRMTAAGVTLDLQIADRLPAVVASEAELELALLNLVVNALDAMPQAGTLTLAADPAPHAVQIQVRDTGSGIAADILPRIFEPWVTTKAVGRGSGLGLSITRDVVNALGGTIVVASTPGEGTSVTITLPSVEPLQQAS
jgi:signal transduction histidine kinase